MFKELTLAYKEHLYNQNKARRDEQEKQYAYYSGNWDKIKKYLNTALGITYDSLDISEMQLQWINLTKKVIDQMAIVYKQPPVRYLVKQNGDEDEKATEYYNSILPPDIVRVDRDNHRLAKLSNCSLTYVSVDKKTKRLKYLVNPIYNYTLETNDEGEIWRITYPKYFKNQQDDDEFYTVVWTDKEHYLFDSYGNKVAIKDNTQKKNPYGEIPFPVLILSQGENIYGEGQNDLINVNEQINLLLTKVINSDIILGTEGTTLGINLYLNKKGKEADGRKEIRTGRKHPIVVNDVRDEYKLPSLQHITTDPHILDIREFIDWYIKMIASMKGLNSSTILSQVKDTSDYQKIMDAVDQMEIRKDDLESCRIFEQERFRITKAVWNKHAEELGVKQIPDGLELKVDFADIEVHKTPQDEREEYEFNLKHNLTNPVEYLMSKNPDLDIKDAEEIIKENKEINQSLVQQKSRFEDLLTTPAEPEII